MKQFIVLITTIVLGIAIAAMIMGFKAPAESLGGKVASTLNTMATEYSVTPTAITFSK